jgi:hypothetical protein
MSLYRAHPGAEILVNIGGIMEALRQIRFKVSKTVQGDEVEVLNLNLAGDEAAVIEALDYHVSCGFLPSAVASFYQHGVAWLSLDRDVLTAAVALESDDVPLLRYPYINQKMDGTTFTLHIYNEGGFIRFPEGLVTAEDLVAGVWNGSSYSETAFTGMLFYRVRKVTTNELASLVARRR